jgi:16S rRNA (guanine966-N2)-methyltransferase
MLKNRVRIIGGQWRGRQIDFNPNANIRPTPNRVRETLFNWLRGSIPGARCLDLFAGSGILGLEALSRGASFVYSIEQNSQTLLGLKNALTLLKTDPTRWKIAQGDAMAWLHKSSDAANPLIAPFDILFIDPPYEANLWAQCLRLIKERVWLAPEGFVYLEANRPLADDIAAEGFDIYRKMKASSVYAYLVAPSFGATVDHTPPAGHQWRAFFP